VNESYSKVERIESDPLPPSSSDPPPFSLSDPSLLSSSESLGQDAVNETPCCM